MYTVCVHQSRYVPLRYFIELLNQEKRLVFTGEIQHYLDKTKIYKFHFIGFSEGGQLGLQLFNELWELPNFNAEMLSQNVTCIMFSPPLADMDMSVNVPTNWLQCYLKH